MTSRTGAALASVVFALAIASALAVGGAYVSRRAVADARVQRQADVLAPAGESAIVAAIAAWDTSARLAQPLGEARPDALRSQSELETGLWVTRVTNSSFWLVAESCRSAAPRLCRRIGAVVVLVNHYPTIVSGRGWSDLP